MTKKTTTLETAIRAIATNFNDPVEYQDRKGQTRIWNRLGFAQHKVISSMMRGIYNGLDYNENVRLPKLKDQFEAFRQKDQKTEIDKAEMAELIRRAEECNDQILEMQAAKAILDPLHVELFGKEFEYKATVTTKAAALAPDDKDIESMEASAAALFG